MSISGMPGRRADQPVMARNRTGVMIADVRTARGIPGARYTELAAFCGNTEASPAKTKSSGEVL